MQFHLLFDIMTHWIIYYYVVEHAKQWDLFPFWGATKIDSTIISKIRDLLFTVSIGNTNMER